MIVVQKDVKTESGMHPFHEMFQREMMAYCSYRDWKEDSEDTFLELALEEMMEDEFLHARFLRDYMIKHELYKPEENDADELKYWKIHREIFG
jgi:hypothetical protein